MALEIYKKRFEERLPYLVEQLGDPGVMRDACEYALQGGKRLRACIVLMIADALGRELDVEPAAFSVECFHSASLIADDLPCMDNDAMRRGRPSLHRQFGESTALLVSYTLIAAGYGGVHQNGLCLRKEPRFVESADLRTVLCLETITRSAGLHGATQGQFLDLYPPNLEWETLEEIFHKKTVTLFEISFVLGWVFGGGDLAAISQLKKCASHLGMAFQIADDWEDGLQDAKGKGLNVVSSLGAEKALLLFERERASFKEALITLNLWTAPFQELFALLGGATLKPLLLPS